MLAVVVLRQLEVVLAAAAAPVAVVVLLEVVLAELAPAPVALLGRRRGQRFGP